jgi:hypothetical protein
MGGCARGVEAPVSLWGRLSVGAPLQVMAFAPLMENGGGGEHRPWMFDDETLQIYRCEQGASPALRSYGLGLMMRSGCRAYAKIHESLTPYLLSVGTRALRGGHSAIRPTAIVDFAHVLVSARRVHSPMAGPASFDDVGCEGG